MSKKSTALRRIALSLCISFTAVQANSQTSVDTEVNQDGWIEVVANDLSSLNRLARALRLMNGTVIVIDHPKLNESNYNGVFSRDDRDRPLVALAEKSLENPGTAKHEAKHAIFHHWRQRGISSIFDGMILTNGPYPGEHSLEEYFNWPTDLVLGKRSTDYEYRLRKASMATDLLGTGLEAVQNMRKDFDGLMTLSNPGIAFYGNGKSFGIWKKSGGAQLGVRIDRTYERDRLQVNFTARSGKSVSFYLDPEVYGGLVGPTVPATSGEQILKSDSWNKLTKQFGDNILRLEAYLEEAYPLAHMIKEAAKQKNFDEESARRLLRLANRTRKGSLDNDKRRVSRVEAPEKLYHWTALKYADEYFSSPEFPTKENRGSLFSSVHGEFRESPMLFAWTNPVTGLALNAREVHGGDLLVQLKIRKGSKVVRLETISTFPDNRLYDPDELRRKLVGFQDVDLILHTLGPREAPLFQEWIILNKDAVESTTADPDKLVPLVEKEVAKLRDPSYRFSYDELFSLVKDGETLVYENMEFRTSLADFIEKHYYGARDEIHKKWYLRSRGMKIHQCRDLFR